MLCRWYGSKHMLTGSCILQLSLLFCVVSIRGSCFATRVLATAEHVVTARQQSTDVGVVVLTRCVVAGEGAGAAV